MCDLGLVPGLGKKKRIYLQQRTSVRQLAKAAD